MADLHEHVHEHEHIFGLTTTLMVVELAAGLMTRSLALLADAGHRLSDVAAQGLALLSMWFACKPAHSRKTFGPGV